VRFAQDDNMVDTLASDRSDQSFGEAVLPLQIQRVLSCRSVVGRRPERYLTSCTQLLKGTAEGT
jgi:hypothetical protein